MDKLNRLNLYKENYYYELNLKDNLRADLFIPSGVIILLAAIGKFLFNKFNTLSPGLGSITFIIAFGGFIVCILFALYNLYQTIRGFEYKYLPSSLIIEDYWNNLDSYYEQKCNHTYYRNEDFIDYLLDIYTKCNETNTLSNEKKSVRLHRAFRNVFLAFIFALIAIIPLYFMPVYLQTTTLINSTFNKEVISMGKEDKKTTDNIPEKIEKPVPPPPRLVKESQDLDKIDGIEKRDN